jgi:hypothetical protein
LPAHTARTGHATPVACLPVMGSDRDDSARARHRHQSSSSSSQAWKWWNHGARHGRVVGLGIGAESDVCAALSGGLPAWVSVLCRAVPLPPGPPRHYFIRFVSHETGAASLVRAHGRRTGPPPPPAIQYQYSTAQGNNYGRDLPYLTWSSKVRNYRPTGPAVRWSRGGVARPCSRRSCLKSLIIKPQSENPLQDPAAAKENLLCCVHKLGLTSAVERTFGSRSRGQFPPKLLFRFRQ